MVVDEVTGEGAVRHGECKRVAGAETLRGRGVLSWILDGTPLLQLDSLPLGGLRIGGKKKGGVDACAPLFLEQCRDGMFLLMNWKGKGRGEDCGILPG